jgi:hypothetical protein
MISQLEEMAAARGVNLHTPLTQNQLESQQSLNDGKSQQSLNDCESQADTL